MYSVTETFHEEAFAASREITARAVFNDAVLIDGNHLKEMTVEEVVCADALAIGATCSSKATVRMFMPETAIPLNNGWVELFVGIPTECPLGKYYIADVVTKDKYKTVEITAYDKMWHLNKDYVPGQGMTFPAKIATVVGDIASQNGFEVDYDSFPDYEIPLITATEREMIGYCAGLMGKNAKFNRDSKLTFVWFTDTDRDIPLDVQYQNGFSETTADSFVLGGLISGTSENPLTAGSGRTITFSNPFMTQEILDSILAEVHGFTYTPCEVKYRCDPSFETEDIVDVVDSDEGESAAVYPVPIMAQTIKVGGGLNATIYAYGKSENSETLVKAPSDGKIDRVKKDVEEYLGGITDNIVGKNGGYYHITYDALGYPDGWEIMNTPVLTPTTSLWKMSAGGFGYSSDGGQTFDRIAFDMEGNFYADCIKSGAIGADKINFTDLFGQNITTTGDFSLGGKGALTYSAATNELSIRVKSLTIGSTLIPDDAAKTATNFITYEGNGLVVGDMTASSLGENVLIDPDGVEIRSGTTTLASFEGDSIYLGKDNTNSRINLCNGIASIYNVGWDDADGHTDRLCIHAKDSMYLKTDEMFDIEVSQTVDGTKYNAMFNLQSIAGSGPWMSLVLAKNNNEEYADINMNPDEIMLRTMRSINLNVGREYKFSVELEKNISRQDMEVWGDLNVSGQLLISTSTNQSANEGIKWAAINSKNPYIGYATDLANGTFVVCSLAGTDYASGLAIGGGTGDLLWKGNKVLDASNYNSYALPLSGGTLTGELNMNGAIHLNRSSGAIYGRIGFYSPSYRTWYEYMSEVGDGTCPTGGKPSSYGDVTMWARRSLVEPHSGYGWIWEAAKNEAPSSTSTTPTPIMALSSNTGNLKVLGTVTAAGGTMTGACNFNGVNTFGGQVNIKNGFEIYYSTPYIDFHFGNSTADWTSRIIESASGTLSINGVTVTTGKVVTATTFAGALNGNASTATSASKLGATTLGNSRRAVYFSNGVPVACESDFTGTYAVTADAGYHVIKLGWDGNYLCVEVDGAVHKQLAWK